MIEKIRHQLFLPRPVSDRLEALAAKPGASKSAILADAVTAWLDRRGTSELDDRFGLRLDRISAALARIERHGDVQLETLALFIHYELAIQPLVAEEDHAAHAMAARRFEKFVAQVARQISAGRHSISIEASEQ